MGSVSRIALVAALAPWLAVSAAIPPEHVHEPDSHHPSAIAHRHFESHDHDGAEFSAPEGRVVWMDDIAVHSARYHVAVTIAVLPAIFDATARTTSMAARTLDVAPPHGPPRLVLSLRAPPAFPA